MAEILLGVFGINFTKMKRKYGLIDYGFYNISKPEVDEIPHIIFEGEDDVPDVVIRTCASNDVTKIHFRLDDILLPLNNGTRNSYTCRELDIIYRNWKHVSKKLVFWLDEKRMNKRQVYAAIKKSKEGTLQFRDINFNQVIKK